MRRAFSSLIINRRGKKVVHADVHSWPSLHEVRWYLQFQLNRYMAYLNHGKRWWWIFIFLWSYLTAPWQQTQGKYTSDANYAFKSTTRFGIETHYERQWWYEMSIDNWLLNQSEHYIFVGDRKFNSGDLEIEENHIGSSNYKSRKSYSGLTLRIWIDIISFSYPFFCFLLHFPLPYFFQHWYSSLYWERNRIMRSCDCKFSYSLKLLDVVW